ncbi:MAG: sigma 54-interacting transcriptional regulator, partial [Deltaproteobacteria bacterium]|nr:sigma 54-interacting transcriptional regulator [Deltaproteobacteria bacterium]
NSGANSKKKGKFELADGGTLFLDEIGDMGIRMQSKILRVLQDNKFQRVGGETEVEVDVRVVAATNKDLEKEITSGRFRGDLFYICNVIPFFIPPLRERKEDIPLLIDYFIKSFSKARVLEIDERAINALKSYDWPGNVRELKNIIERFSIFNSQNKITEEDVLNELKIKNYKDSIYNDKINYDKNKSNIEKYIGIGTPSFKEAKEAFERLYLTDKLKENDNNITKTAKNLGMSRRNLQKRIGRLKINQ